MRNRLQHTHILTALLVLVIIVSSAILGGAWYLIDYALKPGDRSRNEQLAWTEMDSLYPGMAAWRDSLQAVHALRDTFIIAKDGARVHAWYVRAPRQTAATALLVHGYTDCSIRMMPLGRMYNRNLQMNIIVPDLRNAGRTDGDHFQMGWFDRYDVRQWAEVAPALFGDSVRLVVHGVSMGAATTMMLSGDSDLPVSIKAFVEDCGYTSVDEQFGKELKERFGLPVWPLIPVASQLCQWRYGWNFYEASALNQVRHCTNPCCLFMARPTSSCPRAWFIRCTRLSQVTKNFG